MQLKRVNGGNSLDLLARVSITSLDGAKLHSLEMRVIRSRVSIPCCYRELLFIYVLGAFGSGATFAMEDGWILARALELTQFTGRPLSGSLEIFSQIRSPYYNKM